MKLDVFSHCTIDTLYIDDSEYAVPGGPGCYCSLTARALKFDVTLHTKFSHDFPLIDDFSKKKIDLDDAISEKPTTQFILNILDSERTLFLQNMCEPISYTDLNSDGVIISPVFDEISKDVFDKIQKNSNFILLDPQGFLRQINSENKIYLKQTDLNFSNISAIKTSPDELNCLTGNRETDGMKILQKKGIENVILTDQQNISLLVKDKIYSVKLPNIRLFDTTGLGDIFCSVFCCTMLKEKDFLWAFCFAAGAVQAALESRQIGLEKIPIKAAIESNGSYFYHTVKFRDV